MVADAVLSLISSIVGGVLVLAGNFVVKRAEDRRAWLIRLQEAAGDLATSYLQEAAAINDARRAGEPKSSVPSSTYVVDRQKALGRFGTLPWSGEFETQRKAMGRAIEQAWLAWDDTDDAFQHYHDQARTSASEFMQAVGHLWVPDIDASAMRPAHIRGAGRRVDRDG